MIYFILIIISLLLFIHYYTHSLKKIEKFKETNDTCIKETYNKLSDGTKTFFSNEMINTMVDKNSQFDKIIDINNNESNENLGILNKSIKSSSKKIHEHTDLYNKYTNDLQGVFRELNTNLDISKGLIDGRKMNVDSKFRDITNNINSMVDSVKSSGIQNKLTAIINPQIDKQLVEKATKAAEDYNLGTKMANRINNDYSKIYEWQFIDSINDTGIFRVDADTGEVECLSYDGVNCVRDFKSKYGNNMTNIKSEQLKPVQCGPDLVQKYGMPNGGYGDTNHWCTRAYHHFAKMGQGNIDFNTCPKDWSLIDQKTNTCIAPLDYKPPTNNTYEIKGRFVRITINNRFQNWLQLAEVEVISNNRNIALGKPTSSSSVHSDYADHRKAVDGNTDGNWGGSSLFHSGTPTGPEYWEVDLGDASQIIDSVIVYNRTDCCGSRLSNWLLSIYDNNNNLIWARIYKDPPNPSVQLDIKASDNDMRNSMIKDYKANTTNSIFEGSEILTLSQKDSIMGWLTNLTSTKLLYTSSRDGMNASAWHNKVDNKGANITIFKNTHGHTIGGYTSLNWNGSREYKEDKSAFLFSLDKNQKYPTNKAQYAIYDSAVYGPTFGNGHDICIWAVYEGIEYNHHIPGETYSYHGELTHAFPRSFKVTSLETWQIFSSTTVSFNDDRCKSRECVSLSIMPNIEQKQRWSALYNARFPFKLNIGGITEKHADVSKKTNKEIDLLIGNTENPINNSLEKFKFYKNGIVIKTYKTSNNFLKGESYNHEFLASNINFNWGADIIMALPGIKDYVYLELIGYIKVPSKKVIFRLGSDDHSRLYISNDGSENNMVKVINNWRLQPYATVESNVLQVSENFYIPFKIDFIEVGGLARLTLEWALDDNAFKGTTKYEIISKEYFYYDKSTCTESIKSIESGLFTEQISNIIKKNWKQVPNGQYVIAIIQLLDGTFVGVSTGNDLWTKKNLYDYWEGPIPRSAHVIGITQLNDGTIVGVGGNNDLFTRKTLYENWTGPIANSGSVKSITQIKNGTIVGIGMDNGLMTKKNLYDKWEQIPNGCCIISIRQLNDGTFLGVSTKNLLWTKKKLNDIWEGPLPNSCCVRDITQLNDGSIVGVGMDYCLYIKDD